MIGLDGGVSDVIQLSRAVQHQKLAAIQTFLFCASQLISTKHVVPKTHSIFWLHPVLKADSRTKHFPSNTWSTPKLL